MAGDKQDRNRSSLMFPSQHDRPARRIISLRSWAWCRVSLLLFCESMCAFSECWRSISTILLRASCNLLWFLSILTMTLNAFTNRQSRQIM
jgi:hypothetical protein